MELTYYHIQHLDITDNITEVIWVRFIICYRGPQSTTFRHGHLGTGRLCASTFMGLDFETPEVKKIFQDFFQTKNCFSKKFFLKINFLKKKIFLLKKIFFS